MPRKLIPSRRSGSARRPQHDRLSSQRRRFVFGLPHLPLLAFRPHLIPIFVDLHNLPLCTPNARQPWEIQIPANPAATRICVLNCGLRGCFTPRKSDFLTGNDLPVSSSIALAPVVHAFSAILGTVAHLQRDGVWVGGRDSSSRYLGSLTICPRAPRFPPPSPDRETQRTQPHTPGSRTHGAQADGHSPGHFGRTL